MRMRKLGHSHSIMFFAPLEVDRNIRSVANKGPLDETDTMDIVQWAIRETCNNIIFNSGRLIGHSKAIIKPVTTLGPDFVPMSLRQSSYRRSGFNPRSNHSRSSMHHTTPRKAPFSRCQKFENDT